MARFSLPRRSSKSGGGLVRAILLAYPSHLRRAHGDEIALAVSEELGRRRGIRSRARWLIHAISDVAASYRRPNRSTPHPRRPRRLPDWSSDLRSALRLFTSARLVAAGAVLTLGLGIGAATAIYSLADATLLHPLPIRDADRILQSTFTWSHPDFRDLGVLQRPFTDVAAWSNLPLGLEQGGRSTAVVGTAISGSFARMIELEPIAGRLLDERDDRPDSPLTAMLSERIWTRLFQRDANVIGSSISLNRQPVLVVGIVSKAFRGLSLSEAPEILLPLATLPQIATGFLSRPGIMTNRGAVWMQVAGRLRDGIAPTDGELEVERIYYQLHPATSPGPRERLTMSALPLRAVGLDRTDALRRFVFVLSGATLVTLLLSCATVANLLLVRAERREREMAVRAALGAGRARLARLLTIESVTLGLAGAVIGVLVSRLCLSLLSAFSLPGAIPVGDLGLTINARVLAIAAALGIGTSVIFGLAPLWRMARLDVTSALRGSQGHAPRERLRTILVAVQVALCVLLAGGGLAFGRAVRVAFTADMGFDTERAAMISIDPSLVRYTRDQTADFQRRTLDALAAAPWIRSAGWSAMRPLGGRMTWNIGVPGFTPARKDDLTVDANVVTPGFFEAIGIPIRSGRAFDWQDRAGVPRVGVVSESFVRRFWPDGQAIGRRVLLDTDKPDAPESSMTVIGVAGDIRRGLARNPDPLLYMTFAQQPGMLDFAQFLVVAGKTVPARTAAADAAAIVRRIDNVMPLTRIVTMSDHLGAAAMVHRMGFTLFALFASLAIVLTTLGVYAVVASAVTRRTKEIGIRVALGAERAGVIGLVLRQGAQPAAFGLVAGTALYWWSGGALEAFLLSVPAADGVALAALCAGISLVTILALILPARRALSVDPALTLRSE